MIVELGIGTGRPPSRCTPDCHMAGKRPGAISRDEARRLLATGLRACTHCAPDAQLRILDLPARRPRPEAFGVRSNNRAMLPAILPNGRCVLIA
ncbi:DUF6233 domain-containing protein [Streptomyces sp900105755]|uniref:DUF6233 domain-containing protein n=1 Tax=Streptomyces sp. 900105755 TaxID=3154389 RepID=A0ABV1TV57_9ACTN